MEIEKGLFKRTERLVGSPVMRQMEAARVIIFGVGGVGSWCAESLVRSGIGRLTLVDSDRVCVTNINRQSMATAQTVGQVKVEALKRRLLEINPKADITACQEVYCAATAGSFRLDSYQYIIDAIDSLENKALLIREACQTKATFFSSMGAALKMDPSRIQVAEFWKVKGCPLAAALRRKFKKSYRPARKFKCVFSDEQMTNQGSDSSCETIGCPCSKTANEQSQTAQPDHKRRSPKAQINGSLAHITAIFGFTLAGLVVQDIRQKTEQKKSETLLPQ